jgi:hypothetical protein
MNSILDEIKPKKTKPVRTVAAIMDDIQAVSIDYRKARQVAIGTEREALDAEKFCSNSLIAFRGGEENIDNPDNARGVYRNLGDELTRATNLRNLSNLLSKNEMVIEARSILDPLFEELATAQENERNEAAKAAAAVQELRDAKAAARVELEGQIGNHPLVVQAAKKLEPFRRKGELVH